MIRITWDWLSSGPFQESPDIGYRRTYAPTALKYAYGKIPAIAEVMQRSGIVSAGDAGGAGGGKIDVSLRNIANDGSARLHQRPVSAQ